MKLLQLRQQRGKLRVIGAESIDLADLRDDERSRKTLSERLRNAITTAGFIGKKCTISLARRDYCLQSVRMPSLEEAELSQAVGWEASERFRIPREKLEVDYIRMGEIQRGNESRDEVLLIGAHKELLHKRLDPLMESGLRPTAIDTDFTSIVRCHSMMCRRESDRSEVRAILEIGSSGSMFLVLHGDQIALCKPIPIGGEAFDQAVAEHLAIDIDIAHGIRCKRIAQRLHKQSHDEENEESTERAIFEASRSLIDQIVKEVGLCLRYYGVTFRGKPPARIILAGGDALEPRLDQMLGQTCKVSVLLDDPVSPVAELFEEIEQFVGPAAGPAQTWAVAAGLSLREVSLKFLTLKPAGAIAEREVAA